jgi:signal transduction histidine kinase/transcriptional regulator with PAS, ATPase and Fis domain
MDMTRSPFRLPIAECCAIGGVFFGAWLIHHTFTPAADTPNYLLLCIGALDILLCIGLLGYLLRARLRVGESLPKSWIVAAVVLIGCFVGWIAALFLDSDRLYLEQKQHAESMRQLAKLEESLHHFSEVIPAGNLTVDQKAWQVNHDDYARLHDQLRASLRSNAAWDKELTRIDDQVLAMQKTFNVLLADTTVEQRKKGRGTFEDAREQAVNAAETLRADVARAEQDLTLTYRSRWHAVGASALTGVALMMGCLIFWLIFDRELRRSWKAQSRLADTEARFRSLVENQSGPIAVLDSAGKIVYANPIWQTAFGYQMDELQDRNLYELIHPDDRMRVLSNLRSNQAIPCRLAADYGIWHDVEVQCQQQDDAGTTVMRFHDVRETPELPMHPQPELLPDLSDKLKEAETRHVELEAECARLRDSELHARAESQQHRWLLESHSQANSEGVLILSARGEVLSWNPAFVRLWKLSDDTMAGHTWQTIAAHMESQVATGWDDFRRATAHEGPTDSCWEMTLEGDRLFEVYSQALANHPTGDGAMQFHFRDVTRYKDLETQVREHQDQAHQCKKRLGDHEEQKKSYETNLREHEKRLKHLERQLRDKDQHKEELEATLRDHQDRLHQMHETHEGHADALKSSKEATRRLANGVANDFNNVLSVVLGNTDVLRENLPKDHTAQNQVDEIRQAASRGTELSQRLLAFGRNHLLQMTPIEMNQQLASLEPKFQSVLGHEVRLQWQRTDGELWVKTDAHPLEQALMHVVTHARQHLPGGGTLTIHAERVQLTRKELTHIDMAPGAYIQITLHDTGDGIDDETIPHVFEPYHPIKDGQKGDLSLATAYGILRQSGGSIDVASEKGKGCQWTILLPETKERPQHDAEPARASA